MPQTDFYNVNANRAYPLVECSEDIDAVLSDVRFFFRASVAFDHLTDYVTLDAYGESTEAMAAAWETSPGPYVLFSISNLNKRLLVTFEGDENHLYGDVRVVEQLAVKDNTVIVPGVVVDDPAISGHAVSGYREKFNAPYTPVDAASGNRIEPSRIVASAEGDGGTGKTVIINDWLTPYEHASHCDHLNTPGFDREQPAIACAVQGEVRLRGGVQTRVRQQTSTGQLIISADGSAGEGGRPCVPIPPTPGIDDQDTSPKCQEVLRSLGGAEGPHAVITGDRGVSVSTVPAESRVIVNLGTDDLQLCGFDIEDQEPAVHSPTNANGELCNPAGEATFVFRRTETPTQQLCIWRADGDSWQVVEYPCLSPNACSTPDRPPNSADEVLTMPCLPSLVNDDEIVRNGSFLAAPIQHAAWDLTGHANVISNGYGLSETDFPLMALQPTQARAWASIRQNSLATSTGLYVLQFEAFVRGGELRVSLVDSDNDDKLLERLIVFDTAGQLLPQFLPPVYMDRSRHSLVVTHTGTPADVALVGFFRLTKQ